MLHALEITNFATIADAHIIFNKGMTVITGATGAGKSVLLDAIMFVFGDKLDQHKYNNNGQTAQVSLQVQLSTAERARITNALTLKLEPEYNTVTRHINAAGKIKNYFNGIAISTAKLRVVGSILLHINTQHSQQQLLQEPKQLALLDLYGGTTDLLSQLNHSSALYKACAQRISNKTTEIASNATLKTQLAEQLHELELAQIGEANEWEQITDEHKELANAAAIVQQLQTVLYHMQELPEYSVNDSLRTVTRLLKNAGHNSKRIAQWYQSCGAIQAQFHDLANTIENYLEQLTDSSDRLNYLNNRIATFHQLSRKYQVRPEELSLLSTRIHSQMLTLESDHNELAQLQDQEIQLKAKYYSLSKTLTETRMLAAHNLSKDLTEIIHALGLVHAEICLKILPLSEIDKLDPGGQDKLEFLVKTNLGGAFLPLANIVSGGELSRISLALNLATINQLDIETAIFDEVDVGLGGSAAAMLGQHLRQVSNKQQIICVTHSPQVAAYGNYHIHVHKISHNNHTHSTVTTLDYDGKIAEIARMLGGVNITSTTKNHAKELVMEANNSA